MLSRYDTDGINDVLQRRLCKRQHRHHKGWPLLVDGGSRDHRLLHLSGNLKS